MSNKIKKISRTSKCKIYCDQHSKERRQYNVTASGRVWPCCFYSNAWDKKIENTEDKQAIFNDDVMIKILEEDPDFNNLSVYDFKTIIKHPFFTEYTYYPGWESNKQPVMCQLECKVEIDSVTNK